MNANQVILRLASYPPHTQRYELMVPNCYVSHDSEADLFAVRKGSGYVDEFEVKLSRGDLLADKNKRVAFRRETLDDYRNWKNKKDEPKPWTMPKYEALTSGVLPINYFWFVFSEGLAQPGEIPDWAGLIEINQRGRLAVRRSPKILHKNKIPPEERYRHSLKLGYRFWRLRRKE